MYIENTRRSDHGDQVRYSIIRGLEGPGRMMPAPVDIYSRKRTRR